MKRLPKHQLVCEKPKKPIVQGFFRRGGVQKRRALIVSKSESFYGAGSGGLPLPLKKPHWGFFLTRLRPPSIATVKGPLAGSLWCRKRGSALAAKKAPPELFLDAASTPVLSRIKNKDRPKAAFVFGAGSGGRTRTVSPPRDFEC